MNRSIIYKYCLFSFLAIAFFLPEYYLPVLEQKMSWQAATLGGETDKKDRPVFIPKKWMIGHYQKHYTAYVKDQSFVRDLMVRFRNQVDFNIFQTIGNQLIIPGQDGMLYSKNYIEAVIRSNVRSKDWIQEEVRRLKYIMDYFAPKGTSFLVISPPSKARVYPDKLPSNLQNLEQKTTNRSLFKTAFEQYDIPFIDFDFLIGYESQYGHPVYPQAGLHWNYLGAALAADTLSHFLVDNYNFSIPTFIWQDTIPYHTNFKSTDVELLRSANLYQGIELAPMPYPEIKYTNLPDNLCPKAIVIGDSYYQILVEEGYHEAMFQAGSPHWNYFREEVFKSGEKRTKLAQNATSIMEQLATADIVIIASSETNLSKFSYSFIDFVYEEIQVK